MTATVRIAANVRAEMARHQMSTRRAAEVLGLSAQALSRRTQGLVDFRSGELEILAQALGVEAGIFFAQEGS
jgi:transcriptional regulator with XRE-family HTH domain